MKENEIKENKNLVGVYGSLREGMGNYFHFLDNDQSTLLGEFKTEPQYTMVSLGGFPGLYKEGNTSILVEVFEVTDEIFRRLDGLEGYRESNPQNSMYIREQIETPYGDAWIYIYNGNGVNTGSTIVESGDWVEFRNAITNAYQKV